MKYIEDILKSVKNTCPKVVGIVNGDQQWTYEEIYEESLKISLFLSKHSVKEKAHIGIHFNNSPEFIFTLFGVFLAECIAVPLPYYATKNELQSMIKNCDIDLVISNDTEIDYLVNSYKFDEIREQFTDLIYRKNKKLQDKSASKETDVALLLTTSGSTSVPKVVMLSHKNIISSAKAHLNRSEISEEVFIITMPIHFSSTITTQIMSCILSYTKLILLSLPIMPKTFIKLLKEKGTTSFSVVPSFINYVFSSSHINDVFRNIKTIIISGDSLSNQSFYKLKALFPTASILQTYGLTEASPRVSMMAPSDEYFSTGHPVEGVTVKIMGDADEEFEPNKQGEIWVKGPNVMVGYYKNEQITSQVIKNDWLRTGDIGYKTNDGRLQVVGRIKNILNVGGVNVIPEEIEEIIKSLPYVAEAIVIGHEDTILNEIPIAYIVLTNNKISNVEFQIRKFCQENLSNYKVPKEFIILNELPKTLTGKIDRVAIKKNNNKILANQSGK